MELTRMKAGSLSQRDPRRVETIGDVVANRSCPVFFPKDNVQDIVRAMHGHHSGAAGVVDGSGRFIGMITEREILRRVFRMAPETAEQVRFADEGKALLDLTAWDVMIAAPATLSSGMAVEQALEEITMRGYRYMPVVNDSGGTGRLLGIIGERELFQIAQERARRELQARESLLSYFMHHEPYGTGALV